MKSIHLLIGVTWLLVMMAFALRFNWAWYGMIACATAALWYLPFGTLLSVVQILLFLQPQLR